MPPSPTFPYYDVAEYPCKRRSRHMMFALQAFTLQAHSSHPVSATWDETAGIPRGGATSAKVPTSSVHLPGGTVSCGTSIDRPRQEPLAHCVPCLPGARVRDPVCSKTIHAQFSEKRTCTKTDLFNATCRFPLRYTSYTPMTRCPGCLRCRSRLGGGRARPSFFVQAAAAAVIA